MLGMDRVLPGSRMAGQYLLSYLPISQASLVCAVSGCCLLARRKVLEDIGPLDEAIFGFGEDIDWCFRAGNAGWEVWYFPGSELVHRKGLGGARALPYHKAWGIHQAMWVFYSKHLRRNYLWPVTAGVWLATGASLACRIVGILVSRMLRLTKRGSVGA